MNTILNFAGVHPVFSFLSLVVIATTIVAPFRYAFLFYNRKLRSKNVQLHGWPKPPIDADGDLVYPQTKDDRR
jgi:hypothetical protein